ncbi:MAG: hypothetical protein ABR548_00215 [Actinomycetota bacterium]|nr:hypothetical protein [Actinomycetota bacterium]
MRKIVALTVCLLLVPVFGRAGTVSNPEIVDGADDTTIFAVDAPYTDLVGVWFTSMHDRNDVLTGFSINIGTTVAPGATDEVSYDVGWYLDAGQKSVCYGDVLVDHTHQSDVGPYIEPQASLFYSCGDDDDSYEIANLTLSFFGPSSPLQWETAGGVTTVRVPFSAFTYGTAATRYHEGAKLVKAYASSDLVLFGAGLPADDANCPVIMIDGDESCSSTPFVLGS